MQRLRKAHREEARGAMEHQRRHKDPTPLPEQLALGEALWVALLRLGYQSMNALTRREGFRLHIISFTQERSIEISYYYPSGEYTDSRVEGRRMEAIVRELHELIVPVLGKDGVGRYAVTRKKSFLPEPAPLSTITISCPPAEAIRAIRRRVGLK